MRSPVPRQLNTNFSSSQLSSISTLSSPQSPLWSPVDLAPPRLRPAKALPYELLEHCTIYFEEGLYGQALAFLSSLVTSGATSHQPRPAFIPSPILLRLIATLTVHPSLTIRAKSQDSSQAAVSALSYLRFVLQTAGPIHTNLAEAFVFTQHGSRAQTKRRRTRNSSPSNNNRSANGLDDGDPIENELAHSASLFSQADSFWHAVGWAFNCSCRHITRWDTWSSWLDFMLDVLQADWDIRNTAQAIDDDSVDEHNDRREAALIVRYIVDGGAQIDSGRMILRAVFADGKGTALSEFPEVWRNETKELKKPKDGGALGGLEAREEGIDMEADEYGDYISGEENEEDLDDCDDGFFGETYDFARQNTHNKARSSSDPPVESSVYLRRPPCSALGGSKTLQLRYRFLALLSAVCHAHPAAFTSSISLRGSSKTARPSPLLRGETTAAFYTLILSHLRTFPLSTFHVLFSPSTLCSAFPADAASVLVQVLLHRCNLIETPAPEPSSYILDQERLIENYLPWGANSSGRSRSSVSRGRSAGAFSTRLKIVGNSAHPGEVDRSLINEAKVSICIEALLRLLDGWGGGLDWTPQLQQALEQGINRRERGGAPTSDVMPESMHNVAGRSFKAGRAGRGRTRGRSRGRSRGLAGATEGHKHFHGGKDGDDEGEVEDDEILAWTFLRASSDRMKIVLKMAKERGVDKDKNLPDKGKLEDE